MICSLILSPLDYHHRPLWTDEVGEILIAKGDAVTIIQPNQDQNGKYWFDSLIITEFEISLVITEFEISLAESVQLGADTDGYNQDKYKCYLCEQIMKKEK